MTQRRQFLITLIDGGGSVPPALSVARALVDRGHDVRVQVDRIVHDEVRAAGAEPVNWVRAPQRPNAESTSYVVRDWEARTPVGAFTAMRDDVMVGPAARFAADVLDELARRPADVVVTDPFVLGAQIAAERAGLPRAVLSPNLLGLPGWGVPPIGPGFAPATGPFGRARDHAVGSLLRRMFDTGLDRLNAVRADHGLAPVASVLDQISTPDRMLILTSPAFEFEGFAPPPHVRITGPRLDDPTWAGMAWTPPVGDDPLVLVGLTSTYMQQEPLLRRIATALGQLPVRGVVTTGPCVDPAAMRVAENVTVLRSAPHREVLRHAAAVVTHAGHGTVIKALAAGVPVLAMPLGRDQLDNAARVVHHGAGLRLSPKAKPERIGAAVRRLLDEPAFADGARRQAAAIAEITREDLAVQELEQLAGARSRAEAVLA